MTEWLALFLDVVLIAVVGAGVVQAMRLIRQLQDLRTGRVEMERFVRDFNGAVLRAEAGIKALRSAARETGDDLEKLVEKGRMVRDELNFIVESADGVAERLSGVASKAMRAEKMPPVESRANEKPAHAVEPRMARKSAVVASVIPAKTEKGPLSRAEQELIQALKKLG
jgi:hypothetical protein